MHHFQNMTVLQTNWVLSVEKVMLILKISLGPVPTSVKHPATILLLLVPQTNLETKYSSVKINET